MTEVEHFWIESSQRQVVFRACRNCGRKESFDFMAPMEKWVVLIDGDDTCEEAVMV